MAPTSQVVKRLGVDKCELCLRAGTESNPLTRHHCDGNKRNNVPENFLVVHRILCHTFADFITQWYGYFGKNATAETILAAWHSFNWEGQ